MPFKKKEKPVEKNEPPKEQTREERVHDINSLLSTFSKGAKFTPIKKRSSLRRIPSGSIMLDIALGGGWPAGRINMVYGKESSAKTTILLKTIREAQKMCMKCFQYTERCECDSLREPSVVWLDAEEAWNDDWAKKCGVNIDESAFTIGGYEVAEDYLDAVKHLILSRKVDIIVLDSLAALTPEKEYEASTREWQQGLVARLNNKAFRAWTSALCAAKSDGIFPTLFLVNQIRYKIGTMAYGDNSVKPGGAQQNFDATTIIKMWQSEATKTTDETLGKGNSTEDVMKRCFEFKAEKNKSFRFGKTGFFDLVLANSKYGREGDVDDWQIVFDYASKLGVVEREGNNYSFAGNKYKSQMEMRDTFLRKSVFYRALKDQVVRAMIKKGFKTKEKV